MTNVFSLQKIFDGRILQVPDYQRGYAWGLQQWQELLEDIEFLAPGKDHYTGSLVLHQQSETKTDEGGKVHEVFHVVDGQQRLTTLVLLLDAMRARLTLLKPKLAEGILTTYIEFPDGNGQSAFKLRLNTDCHEYFVHNVLGNAPGPQGPEIAAHARLRDARKHLGDYLEAKAESEGDQFLLWIEALLEKITQRLKVGFYLVGDSTEVGVIFEVMNNRGKPLSELEKVKNYLLYVASKLHVAENDLEERINLAWAEVFRRLMTSGLTSTDYEDRLLRAHWLMCYDPALSNWEGSKSIKNRFHLRLDAGEHKKLLAAVLEYVGSLRDSVLAFCEVFAPSQTDAFSAYPLDRRKEVSDLAVKLPRVGVLSPFLPALMAIRLKFPTNIEAYVQALQLFELYAFRVYRWTGRRANAGQTRLVRLGYELYHGETTVENLSREVRQKALSYSPDDIFKKGFDLSDEDFYAWRGIRYLLYEYELHLSAGRGVKMRWEDLQSDTDRTIEHILPQNAVAAYWMERFDEAARKVCTHHLGNLMLTSDNSSYGRKPYPEKRGSQDSTKPCYANSSLFMERKVAKDYEDWDQSAILKRIDELKNWAFKRWHIESSDLTVENVDIRDEDEEPEIV